MSPLQADEMIAACEAAGVNLGLIMNHRYALDNIRTKHAMTNGALGDHLIGSVVHSSGLTGPLDTSPWRGKMNRAAGGVLSTQAIHFLDLLLWFMGPVASVEAITDTLHWDIQDHEDTAVLALRLKSGALATLTTTNGSPIMDDFTGTRLEIHGKNGWVALEGDVLRTFRKQERIRSPDDRNARGAGRGQRDRVRLRSCLRGARFHSHRACRRRPPRAGCRRAAPDGGHPKRLSIGGGRRDGRGGRDRVCLRHSPTAGFLSV